VEPPGGSPTRRIGPFYQDREDPERSLFFWQYNRGKRSSALDLGQEGDRGRFRALVGTADVLLESTPAASSTGWGWVRTPCGSSIPPSSSRG
jgi:crotonobetainyl-CoA:carnitine CoA-transferase CaiB-like acyl-CoA transferase